jgi:L-alanine-DL-glutamate epimerase-like enolase superfamily enzyme
VNDLIGDADPQLCAQRARDALARGQDTVKVKCTTERALDVARVSAIRLAGPSLKIRIDPNESWPFEWAGEQLRALQHLDIEYCEEPLPRGTPLQHYAQLRKQSSIPIALDDSIRTLRDVQLCALLGAADVFILKAQRVGGPDTLLQIVQAAQHHGIPCTVTSSLETSLGLMLGVQCAALCPTPIAAAGIGTARYFAQDIGPSTPIIDGHMAMGLEPGLGYSAQAWWDAQP